MSPVTRFLGKLLGLYLVIFALAIMANSADALAAIDAMLQSEPLLLLTGIIALPAGLALVIGHNVWSGGPLPVVVTLTGWATLIKAAMLLFVPQARMMQLYTALDYHKNIYVIMGAALVLGLYMTVASFRAPSRD